MWIAAALIVALAAWYVVHRLVPWLESINTNLRLILTQMREKERVP